MDQATFVQNGGSIDYTPATDVVAGQVVVQGDLVGVARTPLAANALGSLAVAGVFAFAKSTGVSTAITVGTTLYWDDTAKQATVTSEANKQIGKCVQAAGDDDATVQALLSQ